MNFLNKGIMTGRSKLSQIIQVKPYNLNDDKNKENIDISAPRPRSPPPPPSSTRHTSPSPTNSEEDEFEESLPPSISSRSPNPRRSRSLDRLPTSASSLSDRRSSFFDVRHHTHSHSLGSPQLAPVFTTTYRNIFSTISNANTPTMNGNTNNYNRTKNSLSNGSLTNKFKTTDFAFQKSPKKRRAKW